MKYTPYVEQYLGEWYPVLIKKHWWFFKTRHWVVYFSGIDKWSIFWAYRSTYGACNTRAQAEAVAKRAANHFNNISANGLYKVEA